MRWGGAKREGEQGMRQDHDLKPHIMGRFKCKNFLLAWREQKYPGEAVPPCPRWPEGSHLCCPRVLLACKAPPLTRVSCTLWPTNNDCVCTPNSKALWKPCEGKDSEHLIAQQDRVIKDTKLLKTKDIGWNIMEAGWEGTLWKGSSMFILFYNQDIKSHLSWALDIFARELSPLGRGGTLKSKWELWLHHIPWPFPASSPSCLFSFPRLAFLSHTKENVFSCQSVPLNI